MQLIQYSILFNNKELYDDYKKSKFMMFSEYVKNTCGLNVKYDFDEKFNLKIIGFYIFDEQTWLVSKIKYGL